jgi:hypothetical protein
MPTTQRLNSMVLVPKKHESEATEQYKGLRQCYDAAFRELIVQTHRRHESMAVTDADGDGNVESSARAVRNHRDRIVEFLLRSEDGAQPAQSRVQEAAYFVWLNAGCPVGTSMSDWLAAHRQISDAFNPLKRATENAIAILD